ncbi:MAG: AAA family ATPase [Treponema sp.]|jgi:hypothetical protein|nr:AAA family ATPase [Treponema sp.]
MTKSNQTPFIDIEVERCALSGFMQGAAIPDGFAPDIFGTAQHRLVFSTLKAFRAESVTPDILMLVKRLDETKLLEAAGGAAAIAELSHAVGSTANADYYQMQLVELYQRRKLNALRQMIIDKLNDRTNSASDIESFIQNELHTISKKKAAANSVTLLSFADICRTEYEPLHWIVDAVIPEGVTLLFAPPKKGKSILATHLADAVASGGRAFGTIPVKKRDILYLALEDRGRRIKDRLLRQGSEQPDNAFCVTMKEWNGGGIAELDRYKKARPSIELVIIDTLGIFAPSDDNNAYSENYRLVSAIHRWATKNSVSVILVHHSRKGSNRNEGEAWQDEMMGSQGISGAVDTLIFLHKKDTAHEGILRIQGRDIEPTHKRIVFDNDFLFWRILGDAEKPEEKLPEKQEEILAVLEEAGPEGMRLKDIAEQTGKSRQAIANLLSNLEKREKAVNVGRGVWALAQNVNDVNVSLGDVYNVYKNNDDVNVNGCTHVYKRLQNVSSSLSDPSKTAEPELAIW